MMDPSTRQPGEASPHHNSEGDKIGGSSASLTITCHCGKYRQSIQPRQVETGGRAAPVIEFCDCESCRRSSGVLFVSYLTILPPRKSDGLRWYNCVDESEGSRRGFCATCGCHLFKQTHRVSGADGSSHAPAQTPQAPGDAALLDSGLWWVATGTIAESPPDPQAISLTPSGSHTSDGGLLKYLFPGVTSNETSGGHHTPADHFGGSCACGQVELRVRPASRSDLEGDRAPWSPYADLLEPFASTPSSVVKNPGNEKWWIRTGDDRLRYLAGTCACRSCRLITGFEVQTWAFIPRENISVRLNLPTGMEWRQLDFNDLGALGVDVNPLSQYESSGDTFRHFCSRCGTTAFWRNKERPDLVDLSAGLLGPGGAGEALAETYLEWWKQRVSFFEDCDNDRAGWVGRWARTLATNLQEGLGGRHESITPLP